MANKIVNLFISKMSQKMLWQMYILVVVVPTNNGKKCKFVIANDATYGSMC